MDFLVAETWSPYVAGAMIGLLNCIAIVISDSFIGCSSAFSNSSGMLEKLICGQAAVQKTYYKKLEVIFRGANSAQEDSDDKRLRAFWKRHVPFFLKTEKAPAFPPPCPPQGLHHDLLL